MGRLARKHLDCVVYIYPDKESANSDERVVGSGFVVTRPIASGAATFFVTNRHVLKGLSNPVVRLNRMNGSTELFITNIFRWQNHPDGDDISAIKIDVTGQDLDLAWIWTHAFVSQVTMHDYLGLGTEIAMLGRYAGVTGQFRNEPIARFGCIASPSTILEKTDLGNEQETFVVDCYSIPGYSGSPVIAYLATTALTETALQRSGLGPWLLGIDWMHFEDPVPVRQQDGQKLQDKTYVKTNSGLAGVIPAWRILSLLSTFE